MLLRSAFIGATLALAAGAGAAQTPVASPWEGPRLGVSVGGVRTDGGVRLGDVAGTLQVVERDVELGIFPRRKRGEAFGPAVGISLGHDWQQGRVVTGVAFGLDLSPVTADRRHFGVDPAAFPDHPFGGSETTTRYRTRIDGLATLTGRVGLAQGRTLYYVTGGLAAGQVRNRFSLRIEELQLSPPGDGDGVYDNRFTASGVRLGVVLGAGIEHRVAPRTSLRFEVVHFDLRDVTIRAEDGANFGDERIDYRFRNRGQVARLGLSFRF